MLSAIWIVAHLASLAAGISLGRWWTRRDLRLGFQRATRFSGN